MFQTWGLILISIIYMGFLFAVAAYGDRMARKDGASNKPRPYIYALSLAVFCTSWTFFGSVGLAAKSGFDFLGIYVGPFLLVTLFYPFMRRIIQLAKAERITSVADFLAARYGKSQPVAIIATLIAVIGTIPYIALQLKAVSASVGIVLGGGIETSSDTVIAIPVIGDLPLLIAIVMALFAILFGARHTDATEHQHGLMLAIAAESVIKLIAFVAVGVYVTYVLFDGMADLMAHAQSANILSETIYEEDSDYTWLAFSLLSILACLLLPRQFHVTVVENTDETETKRAAWLFPLYLIAINLFVVPIALAGLSVFGDAVDGDAFVLALPIAAGSDFMTLVAFIGGLSAATAMVIVATVALSIMVSNDIVVPWLVRRSSAFENAHQNMYSHILTIRRGAIFVVVLLAYWYFRAAGDSAALVSIGILSFAAIAQLAPAFFGGFIWRRATAKGAIAGMSAGFLVWVYTLLIPTFVDSGILPNTIIEHGPFGLTFLKPTMLFGIEMPKLIHGIVWTLGSNVFLYIVVSSTSVQKPIERLQADTFMMGGVRPVPSYHRWNRPIAVSDLKSTVSLYLGRERTERSYSRFAKKNGLIIKDGEIADITLLQYSEQLLASAIGAASARLVMTLAVRRQQAEPEEAAKLLTDATAAIRYSRGLLQSAIDEVSQGLAVFDADLRLTCWNRKFRELLNLPVEFGEVGTSLGVIIRYMAEKGEFGLGSIEYATTSRIGQYAGDTATFTERLAMSRRALEVRTTPMPEGGFVITFADITDRLLAEDSLTRAKSDLEVRVRERTEELEMLNDELITAKAAAEDANIGKTRFLTAAGHDILQPLNAARLYAASLADRAREGDDRQVEKYATNINASLAGVEEILGAVLEMGRLDTGALKPVLAPVSINEIFEQLRVEFAPQAKEKGLRLKFVSSSAYVESDVKLLRRVLQNLISNAIKYTNVGGVLVGIRGQGDQLSLHVFDTGSGIPEDRQEDVFGEFKRLEEGARLASGLGLGLSIVQRISRVLGHDIEMYSVEGKGTHFVVNLKRAEAVIAPQEASNVSQLPSATGQSLGEKLVLCIDNEPDILDAMATLLERWSCKVITARDADDALNQIAAEKAVPDVIVADYHLDHNQNGLDAIRTIRSAYGSHFVSILATADRSGGVAEDAKNEEVILLRKPVKPAALRAALNQSPPPQVAAE